MLVQDYNLGMDAVNPVKILKLYFIKDKTNLYLEVQVTLFVKITCLRMDAVSPFY